MRSASPEPFKHTVRAKMAAQVDLLRAKVNDERIRDSYDRFIKEKKKKKKRDLSPTADKRERFEKEAKKVKLHHHHNHQQQHAENRSHQPHQLQQNPKTQNFSTDKHVLHIHHHHHHHGHHHHGLTNGTKKSLQPAFPAQKRAVPPQPPALFTFTPLKVVKAQPQELKDKHREKEHKLKLKKENSEANVKLPELKKKKELVPNNENGKSLTLEEYLLKKKKKKKKHRDDDQGAKKVRHLHTKAVQTVCTGLGADLTVPVNPEAKLPGVIKQESTRLPGREPVDNCPPYIQALKMGRTPFLSHQDHYIRSSCLQTGTRYGRFIHEEKQPNGGGSVLHAYADELACLSPAEMDGFAREFLELTFAEKPKGAAVYALTVIHGAASYLPDFLDYFAFNFPNTPVKMEILGKKDIETTTISNFHSQVRRGGGKRRQCS
ncbi:PREDICTED: round spermatid basic protein 1-like [Poecilia mexicana]|uniref:round spermatid basic protein 1-like n=1 Tax=Poecilia mexicana TaxID=48701 RepID=UPI00072E4F68|nr:PREDICTED: round spermatid basic protein 1-like [Poecilia mexicana]